MEQKPSLQLLRNESVLNLVIGSGQNFLLLGSCRIEQLWVWKFSLKNPKLFNFLPLGHKESHYVKSKSTWVKARLAPNLLRVKSMLWLSRVRSGPTSSAYTLKYLWTIPQFAAFHQQSKNWCFDEIIFLLFLWFFFSSIYMPLSKRYLKKPFLFIFQYIHLI